MDILNILLVAPPLLFDGDGEEVQGTLVGYWQDPIILESVSSFTIYAGHDRINLEAGGTTDA